MPPRIRLKPVSLRVSLASTRSRPTPVLHHVRPYSDSKTAAERPLEYLSDSESKAPNMEQLPHVSEEAAALSKVKGETGPQVEEQGTPVKEVAEGDKDIEKHLPKVMKKGVGNKPTGSKSFSTLAYRSTRLFSTMAPRHQPARDFEDVVSEHGATHEADPALLLQKTLPSAAENADSISPSTAVSRFKEAFFQASAQDNVDEDTYKELDRALHTYNHNVKDSLPALKFGEVKASWEARDHLRSRYDPLVHQMTRLIMQDGKLETAEKVFASLTLLINLEHMNVVLRHLATAPAPNVTSNWPILSQGAPGSALPLDPVLYLYVAIDSIAPLLKIKTLSGAGSGGSAVQVPVALTQRARRRTAMTWILDNTMKRRGAVSPFPRRIAEEIISIVEGRSSLWERRKLLHSSGVRVRNEVGKNMKFKKKF